MDTATITQHLTLQNIITAATTVVTIASAVCAILPTPNPTTTLGKIYRLIEMAALTFGKAKQTGIPAVDEAVKLALAAEAAKAGAGVTTGNVQAPK
jgi:hypothetical protein